MIHLALFDYGAGNLHSLRKGLEAGGAGVSITDNWDEALALDALVLPGVGSFGAAVAGLDGEAARVRHALEGGMPALGICLGMQLLFPTSEEATGDGIALIAGRVRRVRARTVPQMGWNDVEPESGPVLGLSDPFTAYFANSFVCAVEDEPGVVMAHSEYDGDRFPVAVRKANTWGVQFHPEKSSSPGLRLLANWVRAAENAVREERR